MDLETDLSRLNLEASAKRRNDFVVKETFCKIVTFYSDAKQLSESYLNIHIHIELQLFWNIFRFANEFREIYKFIVTGLFLWTISTICSSLLVLQSELVEYMKSRF